MPRMLDLGPDPTPETREEAASYRFRASGEAPMVTLFTDASVCPQSGFAGWAAWAKRDGQTMRAAAAFRERVRASGIAETRAIVNGVAQVCRFWRPLPYGTLILVQSDCIEAIDALRPLSSVTGDKHQAKVTFHQIIQRERVTVRFKHVKGHRGNEDKRASVNSWVDREAKAQMRVARDAWKTAQVMRPDRTIAAAPRREGESEQEYALRLAFGHE